MASWSNIFITVTWSPKQLQVLCSWSSAAAAASRQKNPTAFSENIFLITSVKHILSKYVVSVCTLGLSIAGLTQRINQLIQAARLVLTGWISKTSCVFLKSFLSPVLFNLWREYYLVGSYAFSYVWHVTQNQTLSRRVLLDLDWYLVWH